MTRAAPTRPAAGAAPADRPSPAAPGRRRLVVIAVVAVLAVTAGIVWWARRGDDTGYADPRAHGTITLYDASGRPVTSGDIRAVPLAARAVTSTRGPAPYDGPGGKATLFAYQPRRGVGSAEWSGDKLTATTAYPDPDHPTVTCAPTDLSLADYLDEFPARWDGRVQLRVYLGMPGVGTLNSWYSALDLVVHGNTWTVAR